MTPNPPRIDIGYDAADNTFNLWVDGVLVARLPLAEALAMAATICRVAAEDAKQR